MTDKAQTDTMTDSDTKKVLSLGSRPTLGLKKPVTGSAGGAADTLVKQSFSHGRSNVVAVEKKRPGKRAEVTEPMRAPMGRSGVDSPLGGRGRATSAVVRQLSPEERDARARALRGAATDSERREIENSSSDLYLPPIGGEAAQPPASPLTRDALRQRELEELRSIQEQEKSDGARRRVEDEARGRSLQASRLPDAVKPAAAPGDAPRPSRPARVAPSR